MLSNLIASSGIGQRILGWIEYAALAIEILAVAIIVAAIFDRVSGSGLFRFADVFPTAAHAQAVLPQHLPAWSSAGLTGK